MWQEYMIDTGERMVLISEKEWFIMRETINCINRLEERMVSAGLLTPKPPTTHLGGE